jgi:hypothetical protein
MTASLISSPDQRHGLTDTHVVFESPERAQDPRKPGPVARLVRTPWFWAGLCLLFALPWILVDKALDLPPFLLSLGAGWLAGAAISGRVLALRSRPARLASGAAVVAACIGALWLLYEADGIKAVRAVAPGGIKGLVAFLSMASIVGCVWMTRVWLAVWIFGSSRSRGSPD